MTDGDEGRLSPVGVRRMLLVILVSGLGTLAGPGPVPATGHGSLLVETMDHLWSIHAYVGVAHTIVGLGTQELARNPGNYAVAWRVARAQWWIAYTQGDPELKKGLAEKAMKLARQAMDLSPDSVEGNYVYALAIAEYGTAISLAKAVWKGVATKFEAAALKSYELDRDFADGGPIMILGRYYCLLPWPLRDLEKSRRYLEELKNRHPDGLYGRHFLAATYRALGADRKAWQELEYVLCSDQPEGETDPAHPKRMAAKALKDWFPGARLERAAGGGCRLVPK